MTGKIGPLDIIFIESEIINTIKLLKLNKSNFGVISNEMLKCNPKAISKVLCHLFNFILHSKVFPEGWNLSLIKPIHKSGSTLKHENYRGICISNHLTKLFTQLLNKRLTKWTEVNKILPENSLGFCKGLRTEDGLFVLESIIDKYARKGSKVYACFVDFSKFYDTISHDLLFSKLANIGLSGNFYFLLRNMYHSCKYAVKVQLPIRGDSKHETKSPLITYKWYRTVSFGAIAGLKQGCSLSPLLANTYLSDLHSHLELGHSKAPVLSQSSVTSVTWADDLLITSLGQEGLQHCINNLHSYTKQWGLELSFKKTRCVIFSKGHTNYDLKKNFIFGETIIQFESFYKYLGVEINDNSQFSLVKIERVKKARKAIGMIKKLLSTTGNVSVKLAKKLFESKIEPILTYGSIIWAIEKSTNTVLITGTKIANQDNVRNIVSSLFKELWEGYCPKLELVRRLGKKKDTDRPILIKFVHSHDKHKLLYETKDVLNGLKVKDNYKNEGCQEIEQIQDSFLKYCINVSKHCSNIISRAELGKFPLQFKVQAQMIKYFLRIAQGTGNKLLDEAYACSQETDSTWIQNVERFLKSNGFANVFTNPCTVNKDTFHQIFLNRLQDMYVQDFRYSTSSKTEDYTKLYSDINRYELQDYLEKIKNVEHRKFFVKLRTGNNCLFLEKGRYQSLSREQRFCPLCNTEEENLEHFMFKCPELNVQRKSFLSKLYSFTGENFRLEPFNSQLKKIFTLNFKKDNDTMTNIISKGIFDMYKAREKLESSRLKDN